MSISQWSPRLRLYSQGCRCINQPLSSRFVAPLPITTTTTIESCTVRHYASKKLRPAPTRTPSISARKLEADTEEGRQRIERAHRVLLTESENIYKTALQHGVIDKKLTQDSFEDIARRLIDVSGRDYPDAISLKNVYNGDPNTVLGVASALNRWIPWYPFLYRWATQSTADAGATISVVSFVRNELKKPFTTYQTREFRQLEVLANRGIPLAMRMQADVYWDQKRYEKAIELLKQLHSRTYPSNTAVGYKDDITMQGDITAPWNRLAEFYIHLDLQDKANAMMKTGALDYQDPDALMAYAFLMKEQEDWESYEQCVSIAATAGNGAACRRLGNFYYQIFQGKIPSADGLPQNTSWFHSFFHGLLGKPRTLQDFRKLAIDWYELALLHGDKKATRNYVILCREDGRIHNALEALHSLEKRQEDWNSPNIVKLRARFDDVNFQPKIPQPWLEL
jgi:tetratricopeptide (TPR) repeat protein